MLKFALCAGVCYEWVTGPPLTSLAGLPSACLRALLASLLAWIVLEVGQALWKAAMLLDDRRPRRIDARPGVAGK